MVKNFILIVAGGVGSRMNQSLPKQFLLLGDKPVLMHTIERFSLKNYPLEIVVVLAQEMLEEWQSLCIQYNFTIPIHITVGGKTRFQSVRNGLVFIQKNFERIGLIGVHDAARPIVTEDMILRLYQTAEEKKAVVPAIQSTNSIRIGTPEQNKAIVRQQVWQVQTPQIFESELLFRSFEQSESPQFTDEGSVVEKMGNSIYLVEGDHKNIKITYEQDLAIAQTYLADFEQD